MKQVKNNKVLRTEKFEKNSGAVKMMIENLASIERDVRKVVSGDKNGPDLDEDAIRTVGGLTTGII